MIEAFLTNRQAINECQSSSDCSKRTVIVFHSEFSSERGPGLLRFLRNEDRAANRDAHPKLFYPALYLLEGGYKAFNASSALSAHHTFLTVSRANLSFFFFFISTRLDIYYL